MIIKKYIQFIKEADEPAKNNNKYTELKDEVKSLIEKTIEKSGGEYKSFIDKYVKSPEDVKIEGLINDSDIYDFYLKWRNDIDEKLNDIKFFDEMQYIFFSPITEIDFINFLSIKKLAISFF